jgi:hypothetical protein
MTNETDEDEELARPSGRVHVFLRLIGRDLDPEEVTTALGLQASTAFRRGDSFVAGKRERKRAYGAWTLSTEGAVHSEDLEAHCVYLRDLVLPVRERLSAYLSSDDVDVDVAFWWEPSDGPVGFTLPSGLLRELGSVCDRFDFYFA